MRTLLSFTILMAVKVFSRLFYRIEVNWINSEPSFDKVRLIALLNHTSLYEVLYLGILPVGFMWRLARKLVAPGADKTLNRPFVGLFWKILSPGMISITRKRDKSWMRFMKAVHDRAVIAMALEGRMKRTTGLDLQGRKMTVRSGVADIIDALTDGNIIMAYSGGLHHVQVPGQKFPRLFKTLKLNIEILDIDDYKSRFNTEGIQWKRDIVADMQSRLEKNCPQADSTPKTGS